MKTSLQTYLVIGFLGLLATPVASMEKISVTSSAVSLEGVMSRSIASSFTSDETNILKLDSIESINLLPKTNISLLETDVPSESAFSLTTENGGSPSTSSVQIPLIQF
ncbi:hypothetical protein [Hyella patelloides]|uniref:hypothetical protein n=1 Tax=Hyella patelloides TaxID=1982969 RepID=UPI0011AA6BBC|nr:hypothetical protein [Hyella patelloides]